MNWRQSLLVAAARICGLPEVKLIVDDNNRPAVMLMAASPKDMLNFFTFISLQFELQANQFQPEPVTALPVAQQWEDLPVMVQARMWCRCGGGE